MTTDETGYRFVPSVRQGLPPEQNYQPGGPPSVRGKIGVELDVTASDPDGGSKSEVAEKTVRLYGPGEVIGLDHRQVVRCEPSDGTTDYSPNYFPHVEFDNPGLPWLFSPERAISKRDWKTRPWLVLVAIEKGDGVSLEQDLGGPLPVLSVGDRNQLPPPSETWAWAHAQVVGKAGTEKSDEGMDKGEGGVLNRNSVLNRLSGPSDETVSRLVAPRNLRENTAYYACVVPTFEAGRRAGLGEDPYPDTEEKEGKKWDPGAISWKGDGQIRLPVYYHWEFTTGPRGDFESLVRALKSRDLGEDVGSRPIDLSNPGPDFLAAPALSGRSGDDNGTDAAPLRVSGALQPVGYDLDSYLEVNPFESDREFPLHERLRTLLNTPLEALSGDSSNDSSDDPPAHPVVAPPIYGQWQTDKERIPGGSVPEDFTEERWFRGLNIDLLKRIPAGFGTRVVQDNQESLMAAAWDQFGDIQGGNDLIRAAQLARAVGESTRKTMPESFPELLSITGAMHSRIQWGQGGLTLHGRLVESPMPIRAAQPAFRRIVRPQGPLSRRLDVPLNGTTMLEGLAAGERLSESQPRIFDRAAGAVENPISYFGDGTGVDASSVEEPISESLDELRDTDSDDTPRSDGGRDSVRLASTEDDEGRALATEVMSRLDSVTDHCETARDRLMSLETALRTREAGDEDGGPDSAEETVNWLVFERPTIVQYCASIAGSTLGPLNRSLTRLLAGAPDHALDLTSERKDTLLSRMGSIHGDLMETVVGVSERLRASPVDRESAIDDVGRSLRLLNQLLGVVETLRSNIVVDSTMMAYTSGPIDSGERTVEMWALESDEAPPVEELIPVEESLVEIVSDRLGLNSDWLKGKRPEGSEEESPRIDPLGQIMAAPQFPRPMYEPLRDLSPEYLLPGIGNIPKDTVGLLLTNQPFIEAYMIGCSHEMARELLWRKYPTDRRGTYFRHFWNRRGATKSNEKPDSDLTYIHSWNDSEWLGQHSPTDEGPKLVLLVRGKLLQRYPNTRIYAAKAVKEKDEDEGTFDRVPLLEQQYETYRAVLDPESKIPVDEGERRNLLEDEDSDGKPKLNRNLGGYSWEHLDGWKPKEPIFRGQLTEDVTFFGFDMKAGAAARETRAGIFGVDERVPVGQKPEMGWFFVFEEEPHGPRFGLDTPSDADYEAPPYGVTHENSDEDERETRRMPLKAYNEGAEAGWDGLSWGHLVSSPVDLEGKEYVEVEGDRPWRSDSPWAVESGKQWTEKDPEDEEEDLLPVEEWDEADAATWGKNSAHMARITWQRPVRVARHADDMLSSDDLEAPSNDN